MEMKNTIFDKTFPPVISRSEYDVLFENVLLPAVEFLTAGTTEESSDSIDRWLENSMSYVLQLCSRYRFGINDNNDSEAMSLVKGVSFYGLLIGDVLDKIDQLEIFNRNLEAEYADILDVIGSTVTKNLDCCRYHYHIRRDIALYYIKSRPVDEVKLNIIRTMISDSRPGNGLSQEILNIVRIPIESALTMRGIEFPENYFNI